MTRLFDRVSQRSLEIAVIIMMLLVMCVFIAGWDNRAASVATGGDAVDVQVNDDAAPTTNEIVYQ